jgi:hypothetical protein
VSGRRTAAIAIVLTSAIAPGSAAAQTTPAPGRLEIATGGLWMGHRALGDTSANETTGTGTSLKIFTASTDLGAAGGVEGRVAVRVWRSLSAEVDASYAKPVLTITIGNDIENAPAVTALETVQQLTVGAGVAWALPRRLATSRLAPFAMAGGGYLRQVHEGGTLVETGRFYQFGGGVKYLLFARPRGTLKAIGARVDARAILRSRGVAFDDKAHAAPAVGAAAFVRF